MRVDLPQRSDAVVSPANFSWTLVATDRSALRELLVSRGAPLLRQALPAVASAVVTVQAADGYGDATLAGYPLDVLLEVRTEDPYPALDPVRSLLSDICAAHQGWRVKPTVMYDSTSERPTGVDSIRPCLVTFVERLDGVSREFFDREWFVHGGHEDGQEAESAKTRAWRGAVEAEAPDQRYVQNRVLEPISATEWLIDGYTQFHYPFLATGFPRKPYVRVRGEKAFDRWPRRVLQGYEFRIL